MTAADEQLRIHVRAAIRAAGFSQAEVCRQLGLSEKHLSQMLTGIAPLSLVWAEGILGLCGQEIVISIRSEAGESGGHLDALLAEVEEARSWARHGYEIGQKHCSWSDHGVAPAWLTQGWPRRLGSCKFLKEAARYDEVLGLLRAMSCDPDTYEDAADVIRAMRAALQRLETQESDI